MCFQHHFVAITSTNCFMVLLTHDEQDHVHTSNGIEDLEVLGYKLFYLVGLGLLGLSQIRISVETVRGVSFCKLRLQIFHSATTLKTWYRSQWNRLHLG